jgi:hypothetical protein
MATIGNDDIGAEIRSKLNVAFVPLIGAAKEFAHLIEYGDPVIRTLQLLGGLLYQFRRDGSWVGGGKLECSGAEAEDGPDVAAADFYNLLDGLVG